MITSELEEEPFCKDTLQTLETMPAPPPSGKSPQLLRMLASFILVNITTSKIRVMAERCDGPNPGHVPLPWLQDRAETKELFPLASILGEVL